MDCLAAAQVLVGSPMHCWDFSDGEDAGAATAPSQGLQQLLDHMDEEEEAEGA